MKNHWLIGVLFLFVLGACRPAVEDSTPAAPEPEGENLIPEANPEPDDMPDLATPTAPPPGYPAPVIAPTTAPDEGYPAPPTAAPAVEPYPVDESVWIILPVGEQCAGADGNSYADLQEAAAALEAAGVPVEVAETIELMVCQACGCPTSAHYRVQISSANLGRAIALGWVVESEG